MRIAPNEEDGGNRSRPRRTSGAFYSERDGQAINVDMLKVVRTIERLSGEQLVHLSDKRQVTGDKEEAGDRLQVTGPMTNDKIQMTNEKTEEAMLREEVASLRAEVAQLKQLLQAEQPAAQTAHGG